MELFLLYIWLKLDTFNNALLVVSLIVLIISYGMFILSLPMWEIYETSKENASIKNNEILKKTKAPKLWAYAAMVLFLLIPSQQQSTYLVAGYLAKEVATSPEADKLLKVLRKKANELLDEELKETAKK